MLAPRFQMLLAFMAIALVLELAVWRTQQPNETDLDRLNRLEKQSKKLKTPSRNSRTLTKRPRFHPPPFPCRPSFQVRLPRATCQRLEDDCQSTSLSPLGRQGYRRP